MRSATRSLSLDHSLYLSANSSPFACSIQKEVEPREVNQFFCQGHKSNLTNALVVGKDCLKVCRFNEGHKLLLLEVARY